MGQISDEPEEASGSRGRILRAALAVGAERGYDGTTIGRVSRRSGLPASSIYWHLGSKDRLLAEAMSHGVRAWARHARTRVDGAAGDPGEAVHERLRWGAETVMRRPAFWQLGLMLSLEGRFEEPEARNRFLTASRDLLDELAQWWAHLLPDQLADPARARAVATFHLAVLNGFYVARSADPGVELTALADVIARGLLRFVGSAPVAPR